MQFKHFVLFIAIIGSAKAQSAAAPTFPTWTKEQQAAQGQLECPCTQAGNQPTCEGGSRPGQACSVVQPITTGSCNERSIEAYQPCGPGVPGAVAACQNSPDSCGGTSRANFPVIPTTEATRVACASGVSGVNTLVATGAGINYLPRYLPTVLFAGGGAVGTIRTVSAAATTTVAATVVAGGPPAVVLGTAGNTNYFTRPTAYIIPQGQVVATAQAITRVGLVCTVSINPGLTSPLVAGNIVTIRGYNAAGNAYNGPQTVLAVKLTPPTVAAPSATQFCFACAVASPATGVLTTGTAVPIVVGAVQCLDEDGNNDPNCSDGIVTVTTTAAHLMTTVKDPYVVMAGARGAFGSANGLHPVLSAAGRTFTYPITIGAAVCNSPNTQPMTYSTALLYIGSGATNPTVTMTVSAGDRECQLRYGRGAACVAGTGTTLAQCTARVRRSNAYGWGTCTANTCNCPPLTTFTDRAPNNGLGIVRTCGAGEPQAMTCSYPADANQRCDSLQQGGNTFCTALPATLCAGGNCAGSTCTVPNCVRAGVCTARRTHSDGPYSRTMFCDGGIRQDQPCLAASTPNPNPAVGGVVPRTDCPVLAGQPVASCVWSYPVCSGGPNAGKRCDMSNTAQGTGSGAGITAYLDCPGDMVQIGPWGQTVPVTPTASGQCSGGPDYLGPCNGETQRANQLPGVYCRGGNGVTCVGSVGIAASVVCRPETMGTCQGTLTPANNGNALLADNVGALCPRTTPADRGGVVVPGGATCRGALQCTMPLSRSPLMPVNPCVRNTMAANTEVSLDGLGATCNFDEKCTSTGLANQTLNMCLPKDNDICVRFVNLGKETADGGNGMDTTQAPKGCKSTEKCCDGNCCSWNEGCMTQETGQFFYDFQSYMAEDFARNDWKMPVGTAEIKNKPRQCMNQNTWMNATAGLKVIVLPVFGILLTAFCFMQANKNKTGEMSENMGPMLMIFFSFWLLFSYHIMVALLSILVATATMVAPPSWTSWVLFFQILFFWWTIGGTSFFLDSTTLYGGNFIADMVSPGVISRDTPLPGNFRSDQVNNMATNCATYFNFFQYQNVATQGSGNFKYMSNPARTTWGYCSLEFVSFGATFAVFSVLAYFATIVQTTIRCLTSGDSSRASQALTAAKV